MPLTASGAAVHDAAASRNGVTSSSGLHAVRLPAFIEFGADDLATLIEVNALRAAGISPRLQQLEAHIAARYAAHCRLAVYGSLAPGRSNHDQLQDLRGDWHSGCTVRGELVDRGWGAGLGYPALRWSMSGPAVRIELFASDELPSHWQRLDEFEGADYLRIVVPVYAGTSVVTVANLYAAR